MTSESRLRFPCVKNIRYNKKRWEKQGKNDHVRDENKDNDEEKDYDDDDDEEAAEQKQKKQRKR